MINFSVGRNDGERADLEARFLRNKIHQAPQANQVAEQFLDIKVVAVHYGQRQRLFRAWDNFEAHEAQALPAIGGLVDVPDRIKQG